VGRKTAGLKVKATTSFAACTEGSRSKLEDSCAPTAAGVCFQRKTRLDHWDLKDKAADAASTVQVQCGGQLVQMSEIFEREDVAAEEGVDAGEIECSRYY
jgi:hypothetical protein